MQWGRSLDGNCGGNEWILHTGHSVCPQTQCELQKQENNNIVSISIDFIDLKDIIFFIFRLALSALNVARTWRLTAVTLQPKLTGSTVGPGLFCLTDPALRRAGEGASPLLLSASVWLVGADLGGPSRLCGCVTV